MTTKGSEQVVGDGFRSTYMGGEAMKVGAAVFHNKHIPCLCMGTWAVWEVESGSYAEITKLYSCGQCGEVVWDSLL